MRRYCILKKQGFLKGSAILLGMVIITKVLGLMYKIPLTHMLGGTGMGYFSSAYAVFTPIFAIVVSGIPSTIARMTAENYAFERYRNIRKIRRTALMFFSLSGLAAAFAVVLLSGFLSENIICEKNAVWSLIGVAPSVFLGTVMSVERGYYEGLKNMLPTAISEIVETVFKLIFGLGFAYLTLNYAETSFYRTHGCFGHFCRTIEDARNFALPFVTGASILGVTCATGIATLYIVISGRIQGDGITRQMLDKDKITDGTSCIFKTLIKYSFPIALASVITTLTNMADLITINPCLTKAAEHTGSIFYLPNNNAVSAEMLPNFIYGSYTGLAVTVFGLVPTLTAMFGKSILPGLAEAWAKKDRICVQKNLSGMLLVTSIIAVPSGIGISLMSKEILEFLYGGRIDEIAVSVVPLSVLGIGVIFMGISIPCFSVLQTVGRPKLPIVIMLSGGAIKLALNLLLIPNPAINITGAAISTTVSQAVICIWSAAAMIKVTNVKINLTSVFCKPLFAGILCGLSARLCYDAVSKYILLPLNYRLVLLLSILFGSIIYFFSLYLLCVLPKKQIKALFSKKLSKNY